MNTIEDLEKELTNLFNTINDLKEVDKPSHQSFSSTLTKISVTKDLYPRNTYRKVVNAINAYARNMNIAWKLIVPVGAVTLLALIVLLVTNKFTSQQTNQIAQTTNEIKFGNEVNNNSTNTQVAVNTNQDNSIDGIVNSLTDNDESNASYDDNDSSDIDSMNSEISGAYNETYENY